jgi:glucosamine 6-phosphate synthetase-like amidotransferase/phosphosugar isomerase protein
MCGIAGFCLNPKHHVNTTELASQMLLDIEHRGYHATGVAWINKEGKRAITKAPISASRFIATKAGQNVCKDATTAILHTRWATQGSPTINDNNHPIPRGKIVLTHNGHISNDDQLFKQLKVDRIGQVDSEAVAALLAFTKGQHPAEVLTRIQGSAALAWITQDQGDTLHLARVSNSPLWIGQTLTGSLVYGSTEETIENAGIMLGSDLDWSYSADEGEYFKVKNGKIIEHQKFKPYRSPFAFSPNWRDHAIGKYDDEWSEHASYYDSHLF